MEWAELGYTFQSIAHLRHRLHILAKSSRWNLQMSRTVENKSQKKTNKQTKKRLLTLRQLCPSSHTVSGLHVYVQPRQLLYLLSTIVTVTHIPGRPRLPLIVIVPCCLALAESLEPLTAKVPTLFFCHL